ncbi:9869_t:CDS:2, partial [Racocetra persica]
MVYNLFKNKGRVVIDNTPEFLNFCKNSNGLVFWGPYGSGKTALMALLAHELPEENKYASFPCNLPWMERAQVDFAHQPTAPLGVKEVVFLDEINLLFRGNEFQKAQQMQRLGQVWIELREVATADIKYYHTRLENAVIINGVLIKEVYIDPYYEKHNEEYLEA